MRSFGSNTAVNTVKADDHKPCAGPPQKVSTFEALKQPEDIAVEELFRKSVIWCASP